MWPTPVLPLASNTTHTFAVYPQHDLAQGIADFCFCAMDFYFLLTTFNNGGLKDASWLTWKVLTILEYLQISPALLAFFYGGIVDTPCEMKTAIKMCACMFVSPPWSIYTKQNYFFYFKIFQWSVFLFDICRWNWSMNVKVSYIKCYPRYDK